MKLDLEPQQSAARQAEDSVRHGWRARWATIRKAPRVLVLGLLILGLFAGFGRQLWYMQFVRGAEYRRRAEWQSTRRVVMPAPRGVIYDRSGEQLVRNVPSFYVTVVPGYLPDDEHKAQDVLIRLAVLLDLPYTTADGGRDTDESRPGLRETMLDRLDDWLVDFSAEQGQGDALRRGLREIRDVAPYRPLVIRRNVERKKALLVAQEASNLPGISVEVEAMRDYPYGSLLSQVLGYQQPIPAGKEEEYREEGYDPATDRVGTAGIEATYEEVLRGQKGERIVEEDVLGRVLRVVEEREVPMPGANVYLALDVDLQRAAEKALEHGLRRANSPRGAAIAMNPQTGEVLAMVSLPTYDDNIFVHGVSERDLERWNDPHRPLINHAISDALPPGSVFKVVIASAALQEEVLTPRTHLNCPGRIVVPNKYYPNDPGRAQPFYCWNEAGHGTLNVVGGIAQSCDIFFYKVGGGFEETEFEGLGVERIAEYARLFGLGEPTGVELPAESPGLVPTSEWKRHTYGESWSTGDTYNLSIGQGFLEVTPLQMLNVINVVASGGTLPRPQIVHHVTDAQGDIIQPFEPEIIRTLPIGKEHLALVRQGMEEAVAHGTAAKRGQIEGLRIAGKTGTAQFCDDIMCGVGFEQPEHAWFAAFAPVENPEISVIVFLYNGGEGSVTAVPVAREILAHYFGLGEEDEAAAP